MRKFLIIIFIFGYIFTSNVYATNEIIKEDIKRKAKY